MLRIELAQNSSRYGGGLGAATPRKGGSGRPPSPLAGGAGCSEGDFSPFCFEFRIHAIAGAPYRLRSAEWSTSLSKIASLYFA
jgi:hypothetical protein